jgi:hypothetical protein
LPLPQPVVDFVSSLQIVGTPLRANPGDTIAPRLDPNPAGLAGFAVDEVLARLDLAVVLDRIALDLRGPQGELAPLPGATALEVVLKAVEFPPPADTEAADVGTGEVASRELPHLIPQPSAGVPPYLLQISQEIEGLLGKITGSIQSLEDVVGSIAGSINGNLVKPGVLDAAPVITLSWRVEDASGQALTDGTEFVRSGPDDAPSFVFLPEFMEAGPAVSTSQRRIFCTVEVKKAANSPPADTETRTVGPVTIDIPRVPFPTVMLLTEHAVGGAGFPGAVLVAVPGTSLVQGPDEVGSLLQAARQVLQNVAFIAAFAGAAGVIDTVITLLNAATKLTFVRQDVVNDLWTVTRTPGGFLGFGYESWEDVISSLVLVGPPGRTVSLHNRKNTWVGTGAFSVALGLPGTATVASFVPPTPGITPASATLTVITPPSGGSFNDVVSSYKFLPL